jgi:hypothetical protein
MGVFKWMQTILKGIFYNIKFCIELSDDTYIYIVFTTGWHYMPYILPRAVIILILIGQLRNIFKAFEGRHIRKEDLIYFIISSFVSNYLMIQKNVEEDYTNRKIVDVSFNN